MLMTSVNIFSAQNDDEEDDQEQPSSSSGECRFQLFHQGFLFGARDDINLK